MKKLREIGLLILLISLSKFLVAQESPSNHIMPGIFGAGTYNMHKGSFNTYDGILDCGSFKDANTLGWMVGNIVDIPISFPFSLSPRIYFYKADGDFKTLTANPPRISLSDGTLVQLQTEQELNTKLSYFQIDVLGKYNFTKNFYVALGPTIGFKTQASYVQQENIISPTGVAYANGSRSGIIVSGDFDNTNSNTETKLRVAAHLILGADYQFSKRIVINPEIGYQHAFTKVINSSDWVVNDIHAGVGIKFILDAGEKIIEKPIEQQPEQPKPTPIVNLQAKNMQKDGTLLNFSEILVNEQLTNEILPLLPYIFFDNNSSNLSPRYKNLSQTEIEKFDEPELRDSVLGIYHNLLNIIGQRMQTYSDAKIQITGCIEPNDDNGNVPELAQNRALAIKKYLVENWKINDNRISVNSRQLPEKPSRRSEADGREENRRAEITSDDQRILAPVRISTKEKEITPEAIVFQPVIQFAESINKWELSIQDIYQKPVWKTDGIGMPSDKIRWDYSKKDISALAKLDIPRNYVSAEFDAFTFDKKKIESTVQIPVRYQKTSRLFNGKIVRDSLVERYNLIFFDYDKPEVSDFNKKVFKTIHQRIRTNSSVVVTGYTDRIGTEKYNQELSGKRATAIEDAIRSRVVPEHINSTGVGETLIYNNDLPEGRFYNRTVIVDITTPLSE